MGKDEWFKIRSWHSVKYYGLFTSRAGIQFSVATSFCGRKIEFQSSELDNFIDSNFNYQEKTCESCFRNKGRVNV